MVLWTLLNTESNNCVADTLQNAKFHHHIGEGNNFLQCREKKLDRGIIFFSMSSKKQKH